MQWDFCHGLLDIVSSVLGSEGQNWLIIQRFQTRPSAAHDSHRLSLPRRLVAGEITVLETPAWYRCIKVARFGEQKESTEERIEHDAALLVRRNGIPGGR